MNTYVVRRLLLAIPTLFVVTLVVFFSVRLIPGDVIEMMMEQHKMESVRLKEISADQLRHRLGLDVPIHIQYGRWMSRIVKGDLGVSLWTNRPITREIAERLPISLQLGIMAITIGLIISLPIGIYSAVRQDSVGDYTARSFAILSISVPDFWLGTMVLVFPSIWWKWMPSPIYVPLSEDPIGNFKQFLIPAVVLGMALSGLSMRLTRTMMLEVLRQDYVRTAWAKGLKEKTIILRHALKNALIPVITLIGLQIPYVIAGTVIMEQIFSLPGLGRYLLVGITSRDYTVVSGVNLVIAAVVLTTNLAVDLAYAYLDPKIRYR